MMHVPTYRCIVFVSLRYLFLESVDGSLTLDSLLIQLRFQVTPIWYKFGLALGISRDTLSRYIGYPDEECIVEVLDYWLRNREIKPTWRDVAKSLKAVELCQLAENILNVYKSCTKSIYYYN